MATEIIVGGICGLMGGAIVEMLYILNDKWKVVRKETRDRHFEREND